MPSPQGFNPVPTLCTILRFSFLVTDPKNFLQTPSVSKYTNFEGGGRDEKNTIFWSTFSKKCLKTPFGLFFFSKFSVQKI